MAKVTLTGGDGTSGQSGADFRGAINNMFTELYAWLHQRAHSLVSTDDHAAVTGTDKGKFLATDPTTGVPILKFLEATDIPNTIAREAELVAHESDYTNPHHVTAEQLGLTGGTSYEAGVGIGIVDVTISVDPDNTDEQTTLSSEDYLMVGVDGDFRRLTYANFKEMLAEVFSSDGLIRVPVNGVNDTYYGVEVLASGPGITATLVSGNHMEFIIPSGVKLISVKMRFTGYSTLIVKMGTGDMTNANEGNRWMPIVQAWREDTHQQLMGLTTQPDVSNFDTFTISGLINTTPNHIRLTF